ncbi:MAG: LysR family transcriptional regulator [Pseudomonadota bacterium]
MINFRLMRHLWLFLVVAEEKSFRKAALRLGMSQPPLTEQIQVLEQSLKLTLFERSRRGAQLTPIGAAILPAVQKLAEQMGHLEFAVREAVAGQSGVLTIGAITSAMLEVLPGIIEKIKSAHPQLTVSVREIDSADAVPALLAGEIDLAFARLEGDFGETVRTLPLIQERLAVALPHTHPYAKKTRVSLATLAEEDFVMFARRVSPVYFDNLIASCQAHGFSPRIVHEVSSVASQIAFVGCGQGIALVPAILKKLAPENVAVRPLREKLDVVTTAIAWNTKRPNPVVDAVIAQVRRRDA